MSEKAQEKRLKIKLLLGWQQAANPQSPATYFRTKSSSQGALQVSQAQYRHGALQDTTEATLIGLCEKLTTRVQGRKDTASHSGKCDFGLYGTVSVKGDSPAHFQAWVVSNGREFILITHTCMNPPDADEIAEANQIALMTTSE